jgi:hypothetical protein
MTDSRDPVTATLRWTFPFHDDGVPHVVLYRGVELAVRQVDAATAEIELVDIELSRQLFDAIGGPDAQVTFSASAANE